MSIELNVNVEAYRSEDAVEKYSSYSLYPIERYLFRKYYLSGQTILDLACGGGRTTVRLHEMGFKVKGRDLSDILIKMARKRFPYVDFEEGNYCDIKEKDNSFDHVLISHNGLDYAFPEVEREKAIRECFRVLKPGGTFILSSHNIKSLHFSPYYFFHWRRILWKIKNSYKAFFGKSYVADLGMYTFFGSPAYVVSQIEKGGGVLKEMIGFRLSSSLFFNTYFSPYVHYVFVKRS